MVGELVELSAKEATDFLLPRHYSGRKPQITKAFGWIIEDKLMAVCTFGKPASPSLCDGIYGKEHTSNVYELNRLCRVDELEHQLSQFVSACLREVSKLDWIVVSYADTGMHHNGYVYQACNFVYTGKTKQRTDKYTEGNKHSRHYDNKVLNIRKVRTSKHRYVYFATKNKWKKKEWMKALNYPVCPYPKEENQNYVLGEFFEPILVRSDDGGCNEQIC